MNLGSQPVLILRLAGPLRLVSFASGADVTPRSAKAQAILALLGTAPSLRRRRVWLQDKLWSDRDPENGAGSLRQTLHRLREAVGSDSLWLRSDAGWIGLDPAAVTVVTEPVAEDWEESGEPPEFCQGLDVADPEFEDWIRDRRLAFEDRMATRRPPPHAPRQHPVVRPEAPPPTLHVATFGGEDREATAFAQMIGTHAALAVGQMGGAIVRHEPDASESALPSEPVRLSVHVCRLGDELLIQTQLSEGGALLWSAVHPLKPSRGMATEKLEAIVAEATAAAAHCLGSLEPGTDGPVRAGYRALERLFEMDEAGLADCERILSTTIDGPTTAIHRAWRAQARVISVIERLAPDPALSGREALEMIDRSLREDPQNALVNAIAAEVALLFEDRPLKAAHYAQLAVDRNPSSPFAHSANAQALAWLGMNHKAHAEALRALRLARALPNQSFWLMRCAVTAVRSGRYKEASHFSELAHQLAPRFKPPLRFLAALRFHAGDQLGARGALLALKHLEPDFTLSLMEKEDYPTTTLQGTPLIKVARSGLLE
jgi:tetratricopeptide (TPR) repeat protein